MELLLAALSAAFLVHVVDSYYPLGQFRPVLAYLKAAGALAVLGVPYVELAVQAGAAAFLAITVLTLRGYVEILGDDRVRAMIAAKARRGVSPRL